jgi:hypothetical protein
MLFVLLHVLSLCWLCDAGFSGGAGMPLVTSLCVAGKVGRQRVLSIDAQGKMLIGSCG